MTPYMYWRDVLFFFLKKKRRRNSKQENIDRQLKMQREGLETSEMAVLLIKAMWTWGENGAISSHNILSI